MLVGNGIVSISLITDASAPESRTIMIDPSLHRVRVDISGQGKPLSDPEMGNV